MLGVAFPGRAGFGSVFGAILTLFLRACFCPAGLVFDSGRFGARFKEVGLCLVSFF